MVIAAIQGRYRLMITALGDVALKLSGASTTAPAATLIWL